MKNRITSGCLAFALLAIGTNLWGATPPPEFAVSYFLQTDGNFVPLSPGGQLTFPATSIDSFAAGTVVVFNRGQGPGSVNSITLAGGSLQPVGLPVLPAALDSGKELRFGIVFAPRQAGSQRGSLTLGLSDSTFVAQIVGTTAPPEFKLSYFLQSDGNAIALNSGGKLVFPATKVNTAVSATVSLSNYGSGAGYVNAISLTGENFQLSGVGLLPVLVAAKKELRFGIVYNPSRLETSSGVLKVLVDDRTFVSEISGTSLAPLFTYSASDDVSAIAVSAGEMVSLPETALHETSSLLVQIKNAGNAEGAITAIRVSGPGFQLSNVPMLPLVLAPNAAAQFNLTFTPTEPGAASGRLQIGADSFDLVGTGKGPKLLYFYIAGAGSVPLTDNGTALWGRVQVGQTRPVDFVGRNQGTDAATVSGVGIVDAKSAFRLVNLPEFPATIAPGGQITFSVLFSPMTLGDNVARLRVDALTFNLVGSGTPPPTLPAVQLTAPDQALDSLQQPALGLTLVSPYPLPLSGTLTLTVNSSSFSVDPAVQFATGGRSVAFTVPANSTRAKFPGGTEIRMQTGTVAGTITVTAALAIENGINMTPDFPPSLTLQIPEAPPRLLDLQFEPQTAGGFAIVVTGLSTTRSLTELDLDFVPSPKYNLPANRVTLNIESASAAWYRSSESQAYGSLFTARIPFTFQGPDGSPSLDQVFQSVSATLTNGKGRSNSLTAAPHP